MCIKLKTLRKGKGITQEEVAELLGYKSVSGYCRLENGDVKMTIAKAKEISKILKIESLVFFQNDFY